MSPRKMLFTKMDPSCTVGFYCRDRRDLQTFLEQVPDVSTNETVCERMKPVGWGVGGRRRGGGLALDPLIRETGQLIFRGETNSTQFVSDSYLNGVGGVGVGVGEGGRGGGVCCLCVTPSIP